MDPSCAASILPFKKSPYSIVSFLTSLSKLRMLGIPEEVWDSEMIRDWPMV